MSERTRNKFEAVQRNVRASLRASYANQGGSLFVTIDGVDYEVMRFGSAGVAPTSASIPVTDATYDLGSASYRWRNEFLSGNITLGGYVEKSYAALAAAGSAQGSAAAIASDIVRVTGADNAKGVIFPTAVAGMEIRIDNTDATHNLLVYPATGAAIAGVSANGAFTMLPLESLSFYAASATQWYLKPGLRLARGQSTTATASDTIVTGLQTVASVVANLEDSPTTDPEMATASIGDQAGTPAAGSFLLKTWKTFGGTPAAATTYSKKVNWIAVGT